MKKSGSKIIAIFLLIFMTVGIFAGCGSGDGTQDTAAKDEAEIISGKASDEALSDAIGTELLKLNDYKDVYDILASGTGTMRDDAVINGVVEDYVVADNETVDGSSSGYSGTNVQVEGIDEGDIVKTDGDYIYILRDGTELTIVKAGGADTKQLANIMVAENNWDTEYAENETVKNETASEMFISGDKLVVLKSVYEYSTGENDSYTDSNRTEADIYDVSDPGDPVLTASIGQDGYISDTRLSDGVLYVVSQYAVWNPVEDDVATYVPRLYNDGVNREMELIDLCVPIDSSYTSWAVVSSIDVDSGTMLSSQAVLGSDVNTYMSGNNLYIACQTIKNEESEPYTADQYTVVDHHESHVSDIVKFTMADGKIVYSTTCRMPGYVNNQFSMDEYNGNLRVVTTEYSYEYKVYTDEKYGWENYEFGEENSSSGLYVLNESMEVIGSVSGLGEDERVYSARFDGDIAYFVTFKEVDPLFAVDLTDPTAPTVLSALKIEGFSGYLHVYGEGRLLGIGQNVEENEDFITSSNLKLTMFDTTDPKNVTEIVTENLEEEYSEVLYNHHAALVDVEKNIIAFPTESGYKIFRYNEESGFELITSVEIDGWSADTRGLYIGDSLYICQNSVITVLDMSDFRQTAKIDLVDG